jgi:hypothetical protein
MLTKKWKGTILSKSGEHKIRSERGVNCFIPDLESTMIIEKVKLEDKFSWVYLDILDQTIDGKEIFEVKKYSLKDFLREFPAYYVCEYCGEDFDDHTCKCYDCPSCDEEKDPIDKECRFCQVSGGAVYSFVIYKEVVTEESAQDGEYDHVEKEMDGVSILQDIIGLLDQYPLYSWSSSHPSPGDWITGEESYFNPSEKGWVSYSLLIKKNTEGKEEDLTQKEIDFISTYLY